MAPASGEIPASTVRTASTKSRRMPAILATVAAMRAACSAWVGASAAPKLKIAATVPTAWIPAVHASSSPNSCSISECAWSMW